jgi:hypothetical protein
MSPLTGVIRDGRVELDDPGALPDGTRVRVEPAGPPDGFIPEDEWPTTPDGIEAHVRRMESFEPVVLTPEDEARIAVARAAVRDFTLAAVRTQMGIGP